MVELLNNSFSIFKQYYTNFHSPFCSNIFQKTPNKRYPVTFTKWAKTAWLLLSSQHSCNLKPFLSFILQPWGYSENHFPTTSSNQSPFLSIHPNPHRTFHTSQLPPIHLQHKTLFPPILTYPIHQNNQTTIKPHCQKSYTSWSKSNL